MFCLKVKEKKNKRENQTLSTQIVSELNDAAFDATISDGRAFGDLSKPSIVKLLNIVAPGYQPPNRFKIARELAKRYKEYRKLLIKRFETVSNIAFTSDMWKNRKRVHPVVIMAHVLNKKL